MNGLRIRVYLGGSWFDDSWVLLRSVIRSGNLPDDRNGYLGFRLIAEPKDPCICVIRGGSWNNYPGGLRSALRIRNRPDFRDLILGFRLIAESKS